MITPETAVLGAILLCLSGAGLTLLLARRRTLAGWVAFAITATTAGLVYAAITQVLAHGAGPSATYFSIPQHGFALRLYVDGLSAIFLGLAATIAVPTALYSIAYLRHYPDYSVARYYPNFLVFLAAMYGLVSTTDMVWFFFIFWQMMTLPGYALIRFEHKRRENVRAANKYLVMMQIACLVTMLGAELLVRTGLTTSSGDALMPGDFDAVSHHMPALLLQKPGTVTLAFTLFLLGFGIKMGMWPFGAVWLPDAHPAAPSPVSAMLSGVMIKTGVYGLIRYFLWLVPAEAKSLYPMAAWGAWIAGLGTLTLFVGTMQALKQEQSKRLLAFHSIGQIGYILLGVGACLALLGAGRRPFAALSGIALFGALFHTLNHGLFKALLFLNAGSMLYATGTQDLNRLGGLAKYMPLTAVTALIASFSISGVPLFNGFASKWSLYVATIQGSAAAKYLAVCALIAITTSALTLASFTKFFGVSFLSRSSQSVRESLAARGRLEVGFLMQLPQLMLAAGCVALGLFPGWATDFVRLALNRSEQGLGVVLADAFPATRSLAGGVAGLQGQGDAVLAPLALLGLLGGMFLMAVALARLGGAPRRVSAPWLCGYAKDTEPCRYTAHQFYGEIKRPFRWLGGAPRPRPPAPAPLEHPSPAR
jgi:formate hydrogenlyase subunit 3/multisubunit Na+/H+ antiporter MnhD subunit